MNYLKYILPLALLTIIITSIFFTRRQNKSEQSGDQVGKATKGAFHVSVEATGELSAKRSEVIKAPSIEMQSAGLYQTTISNLIPEGTTVKAGDFVAELDRNELGNKIKAVQTDMEKVTTQLDQAKIDTALELRSIRDQVINLEFAKEEKRILVQQSSYEPQSVIRQANIDLEKTERDYIQLKNKYRLTAEKSMAKIAEINATMKQSQNKFQQLQELAAKFRITAPKDGMLIYARSWNGKIGPGSQISAWNPEVAELPDLTSMTSKSYVNEVDISKIKLGQDVKVKVDAFHDKMYPGQVIQIANVGEQMRNYDAKVFEVVVKLFQSDSILRPAMTTSNEILIEDYTEALSIPLDALFKDSLTFIYRKVNSKIIKQEVLAGPSNGISVLILAGLSDQDEFLLNPPPVLDGISHASLTNEEKNKALRAHEALSKIRNEKLAAKAEEAKKEGQNLSPSKGGNSFIIF
jgi:hypothetical protein